MAGVVVWADGAPGTMSRTRTGSGTGTGAGGVGMSIVIGTVAPGMLADLVVLRADPARDVRNTQTVEAVVKGGRLLRRPTPLRTGPGARAPAAP